MYIIKEKYYMIFFLIRRKNGLNIHVIEQESEEHLDEILGEISELKQSTTNTGKLVYYLR